MKAAQGEGSALVKEGEPGEEKRVTEECDEKKGRKKNKS